MKKIYILLTCFFIIGHAYAAMKLIVQTVTYVNDSTFSLSLIINSSPNQVVQVQAGVKGDALYVMNFKNKSGKNYYFTDTITASAPLSFLNQTTLTIVSKDTLHNIDTFSYKFRYQYPYKATAVISSPSDVSAQTNLVHLNAALHAYAKVPGTIKVSYLKGAQRTYLDQFTTFYTTTDTVIDKVYNFLTSDNKKVQLTVECIDGNNGQTFSSTVEFYIDTAPHIKEVYTYDGANKGIPVGAGFNKILALYPFSLYDISTHAFTTLPIKNSYGDIYKLGNVNNPDYEGYYRAGAITPYGLIYHSWHREFEEGRGYTYYSHFYDYNEDSSYDLKSGSIFEVAGNFAAYSAGGNNVYLRYLISKTNDTFNLPRNDDPWLTITPDSSFYYGTGADIKKYHAGIITNITNYIGTEYDSARAVRSNGKHTVFVRHSTTNTSHPVSFFYTNGIIDTLLSTPNNPDYLTTDCGVNNGFIVYPADGAGGQNVLVLKDSLGNAHVATNSTLGSHLEYLAADGSILYRTSDGQRYLVDINMNTYRVFKFGSLLYGNGQMYIALGGHLYQIGADAVLPLHLLNIKGYNNGKTNELSWKTENEVNTAYFGIERSSDAHNFTTIAKVNAEGGSDVTHTYSYADATFLQDINYYRLKMVDKDGKFTYSKIVGISRSATATLLYPNPASSKITIRFQANGITRLTADIVNYDGKVVGTNVITTLGGTLTKDFNISKLAKGIYFVRIADGTGKTTTLKFVKQ